MSFSGVSARLQRLAFWLSLLALCSALVAPASVLAQEVREGRWTGLCGSGHASGQAGQADDDGGHCDLCTLTGLAPPPLGAAWRGQAPQAPARAVPVRAAASGSFERPAIRGPPLLS